MPENSYYYCIDSSSANLSSSACSKSGSRCYSTSSTNPSLYYTPSRFGSIFFYITSFTCSFLKSYLVRSCKSTPILMSFVWNLLFCTVELVVPLNLFSSKLPTLSLTSVSRLLIGDRGFFVPLKCPKALE